MIAYLARAFAAAALFATGTIGHAEDAPKLNLELNAADTVGESCRLTFLLSNGLPDDVESLVAETVLFSDQGGVVLLTLFDFGELPAGRPRVRQFQVPETSCDRLGQVLVNGFDTCTIGGAASGTCQDALSLSSRMQIKLEG
ncbi:MAG: hypothetical protein AAF307_03035 [Pseudomonadota bacterium]